MAKITIKTEAKKQRCGKCKKTSGIIKFYIFPGEEKVRHYHAQCFVSLVINKKKK